MVDGNLCWAIGRFCIATRGMHKRARPSATNPRVCELFGSLSDTQTTTRHLKIMHRRAQRHVQRSLLHLNTAHDTAHNIFWPPPR